MSNAIIAVSDALKEALAGQIPQMFAEEMRGFIEQAQKNQSELEMLRTRCTRRDEEIEEKTEALAKHRSLDVKLAEIETRESKLVQDELTLLRKTIENRAVIAEEKLKTGIEVLSLALRNTDIRRVAFGNEAVGVPATPAGTFFPGSTGTGAMAMAVPTNSTVTETKE